MRVEKRVNEIVNRLTKTKIEKVPDLRTEREERDTQEREAVKRKEQEIKQKEKEDDKKRKEQAELRYISFTREFWINLSKYYFYFLHLQ